MSSSINVTSFLSHKEKVASLSRGKLRHPIVSICNFGYALLLTMMLMYLLLFSKLTVGQVIYFLVTICLYVSSSAYHTWVPSWKIRFADQTMITWFILVISVPFVYNNLYVMTFLASLAVLLTVVKWNQWEPTYNVQSLVFLGLGLVSAAVMFSVGLQTSMAHKQQILFFFYWWLLLASSVSFTFITIKPV